MKVIVFRMFKLVLVVVAVAASLGSDCLVISG